MKTKLYKAKIVIFFVLLSLGISLSSMATNYYFSNMLTGAQENPPVASQGQGIIVGFYDDVSNVISYGISFNDLTGNTTAGHFHAPAPVGTNAPVIIGYMGFPTGVKSGLYTNTHVLNATQEAQLLAGLWYSNIHTSTSPGGEIRGQIVLTALANPVYTFISQYSGLQESPPVTTSGKGLILGIYDPVTNEIKYGLGFAELMGNTTAAHFHAPGMPGQNAPVIIPKPSFPTGVKAGVYTNSHVISDVQETQLIQGLWYANIHSNMFPGGEIRAQLILQAPACTPPTFLNTLSIVGNPTCGKSDGQISIIPTSGTAPFMYSLDGGATYMPGPNVGFTKFNLPAGTYQLKMKDVFGCESAVVQKTLTGINCPCVAPTFLNTLSIVGDATCGLSDGQISIIPTSGTAPFMYSLDGGATYVAGPNVGFTKFNLAAGTYNLKLKDANGCVSATVTRIVGSINCAPCTAPTFLNTMPVVGAATCGLRDGQISIIPTSGTGPLMYSINGGATYISGPNAGYTFFNLPAGVYQLKLKSASGCESAVVQRTVGSINCPPALVVNARSSVGVESVLAETKMTVTGYPNPSRGKFRLQVLHFDNPKAEVSIFDGKGTLVQRTIMNLAKGTTLDVNLTGKAPGIYSIKVVTNKGITTSKVLIQ
jgi:hypothetical protein